MKIILTINFLQMVKPYINGSFPTTYGWSKKNNNNKNKVC